MREIKFRAKANPQGDWVYGHYCFASEALGCPHNIPCIQQFDKDESQTLSFRSIYPDTVGQFTGLLDGKGKEIFEGDIIRIPETESNIEIIGVVDFDKGSYFVRSFFSGTHSSLAWSVRERQMGERRGVIIGNIHDNPELL